MTARQRRALWAAAALGVIAAAAGLTRRAEPRAADTRARIAFYRARLGGPATYPAYARLGLAYLQEARQTGRTHAYDDARRFLLASLRYQRNFEALRGLADCSLARHEFPEALAYAREAAAALPGDPDAQGALFDAYLALGAVPEAARVLEAMSSQAGGFASFARRAALLAYQGNVAEAIPAMARACTAAEKEGLAAEAQAWCQVRLGSLHRDACNAAEAERAYDRALRILPGYPLAREHRAELQAARGRIAEAIASYEALRAAIPGARYELALAGLYAEQGEGEKAAAAGARALAHLRRAEESGSRAEWRPLALLLLEGEATAAEGLRWAERDWENRRDAYAADTLAWAWFRNGRPHQARNLIERALEPGLKEPLLRLHAAQIRAALGETAEARRQLEALGACRAALSRAEQREAERLAADLGFRPRR